MLLLRGVRTCEEQLGCPSCPCHQRPINHLAQMQSEVIPLIQPPPGAQVSHQPYKGFTSAPLVLLDTNRPGYGVLW